MKKESLVKVLVVLMALMQVACDKEVLTDVYSNRGVEHDKQVLKSSSESLDNELDELSRTRFATISHAMSGHMSEQDVTGNALFVKAVVGVGELMYNNESKDCYFEELMSLTFDKDYYCSVLAQDGCGVWQWDGASGGFAKVEEHESDVIFKFPATERLDGDTAVLLITDLAFYNGNFPDKGEVLENGTVVQQALEKLHFSIKVGDELVIASNVNASFTSDGFFQMVAMTFNPTPYNLSGELGKDANDGYWNLAFNHDGERILAHDLVLAFDSSNDNMPVRQIANGLLVEEVVINTTAKTGELYNQLVNIEELEWGTEAYATAFADALNAYASMDVRYLSDDKIIALVEAVPKLNDEVVNQWVVDLEFEFSDGSRESGEEYFEDYLDEFKKELEQMISEFAGKFGV